MKSLLLVALGGAAGSALRYLVSILTVRLLDDWRFPVATLGVNVFGCFLAGTLWAVLSRPSLLMDEARLILLIGLLGGFTTFSAFGLETLLMLRRGEATQAMTYVAASLTLGLLAVWLGFSLAQAKT